MPNLNQTEVYNNKTSEKIKNKPKETLDRLGNRYPLLFKVAIAFVYLLTLSAIFTLFIVGAVAIIPALALTGMIIVTDLILSLGDASPLVALSALLTTAVVSSIAWIVDRLNAKPQTENIPTKNSTDSDFSDITPVNQQEQDLQASTKFGPVFSPAQNDKQNDENRSLTNQQSVAPNSRN